MKRLIILVMLLITINAVQAGYVKQETVNGVHLRFIADPPHKDACIDMIDDVQAWYGIHHIVFMKGHVYEGGKEIASRYFPGGVVVMYGQCEWKYLSHEIAHAYEDNVLRYSLYQLRKHSKSFFITYQDIYFRGEVQ